MRTITFKMKIIIVDKEDKIIGTKERRDIKGDIYRVSALWLTNPKGEILLAKRHKNKDSNPGKWGPAVAGTVEEGESYEDNIIKETEEEIGIKGIKFNIKQKTFIQGKRNHFTQWFTAVIDKNTDEFKIQDNEVEEVRWISKERLLKELKENPDSFVPNFDERARMFF